MADRDAGEEPVVHVPCRVCGADANLVGVQRLLGRHDVRFFLCPSCDFWFSEEPWWLSEAYGASVASLDTGAVRRCLGIHRTLLSVLIRLFGSSAVYVDWAGGPGLLTRLMRDSGLDFYWQDAYSENVYARGFEWTRVNGRAASAVTAIEVFEHLVSPPEFVDGLLEETGTDTIVFSQELHHGPDMEWWFLAPQTGQHIAFYTTRTLKELGRQFGLTLYSAGNLHMLTKREDLGRRFAAEVRWGRFRHWWDARRLSSLTEADSAAAARTVRGD